MSDNIESKKYDRRKVIVAILTRVPLFVIVMGSLLFLPAGTFDYWEAWVYCAALLIPALTIFAYFVKKDPDFIARRLFRRKEKERTQKIAQTMFSIVFYIGILIPGFDRRFGWSDVPGIAVIVSDVFVLLGYFIIFFVFKENSFASAIIETTEGQRVIDTGLYRIVRHPMYTGSLIMMIFTPLALGSYWAIIPFALSIPVALVLRIVGEEKYLTDNLPGYADYMTRTRYRLIPFIW
jgi:protein-S-isoprenylcysteine O-methyltransferase Ste14